MTEFDEAHEHIEDVIDARKRSGQYDILINSHKPIANTRYAYSAPPQPIDELRDEFAIYNIEGDNVNDYRGSNVAPTDSEITLIRVKREGSQYRTQVNRWDMHDKAVPGDGSHLAESPSLVNLVTLIVPSKQCLKSSKDEMEYMVPLSSWEPVESREEEKGIEVIKEAEIELQGSSSSLRGLFRCFGFWRRREEEIIEENEES